MAEAQAQKRHFRMARRRLILGGTLAGGALVVGYGVTHPIELAGAILQAGGPDPEPSAFGSFISIAPDDLVTVVNKQQEMGQGIHAGMASGRKSLQRAGARRKSRPGAPFRPLRVEKCTCSSRTS